MLLLLTSGCLYIGEHENSSRVDFDGDGFLNAAQAGGTDCDDQSALVNPDAVEVCNGFDDDCDGEIDEDTPSWFVDGDGDGFGDVSGSGCLPPAGAIAVGGDCNDDDALAFPAAPERCNGLDDDCDGTVDEEPIDGTLWHLDGDGDGFGATTNFIADCGSTPPDGRIADGSDCNDFDPDIHPGVHDGCDSVDSDCDGTVDEDGDPWYADADGDGFGDPGQVTWSCTQPANTVADDTDCDDALTGVHPGVADTCAAPGDADCDGQLDEDADDLSTFYADSDGDGFGDAGTPATGCTAPSGYVPNASDCEDADGGVNPAATEVCGNFADDDCSGEALACELPRHIDLTSVVPALVGDESGDRLGSVVEVLDFDGSGVGDIVVGVPWLDEAGRVDTGGASIVLDAGLGPWSVNVNVYGGADGDFFGGRLRRVPDLDSDGDDELALGGNGFDLLTGAVGVLRGGATGAVGSSDIELFYIGDAQGDRFGTEISQSGDTDDDGALEFVIGAPYVAGAGSQRGRVFVLDPDATGLFYAGPSAQATVTGTIDDGLFGTRLDAGDLDGDGVADLVVSQFRTQSPAANTGAAYVFLGPVSGDMTTGDNDREWMGIEGGWYLSGKVAIGPDVDGDGTTDVLIGRACPTGCDSTGRIYAIDELPATGPLVDAAHTVFMGPPDISADPGIGHAFDVGDTNGDGVVDLVVGNRYRGPGGQDVNADDPDQGQVWLVRGPLSGVVDVTRDIEIGTQTLQGALGAETRLQDLDGDGFDDVIIGASYFAGNERGAVYTVQGGGW